MASQNSFFFNEYYKNYKGGLKASIPNMNSKDQRRDSSSFNMASYAPPSIQNQQFFSGLEPSDNSFLSGSHELMPFPNDLPSQMGGDQTFSPLNIASSSSFTWPYTTNFHGFNGFVPPSNEIPSEIGFTKATRGLTKVENLNGSMPIPNNMPFEESFAQISSFQNEPDEDFFSGLKPFQIDFPSTSGIVDNPSMEIDEHVTDFDLELMDMEEMTKKIDELMPITIDMASEERLALRSSPQNEPEKRFSRLKPVQNDTPSMSEIVDFTDFDFEPINLDEMEKECFFNGLKPFRIDMPSTSGIVDIPHMEKDELMDVEEVMKNFNGSMPIPTDMASEEGVAQRSNSPNESVSFSGFEPVQNDTTSTSEMVDDTDFDLEPFDMEMMKWLEKPSEEQPPQEEAVSTNMFVEPLNMLSLQQPSNGVVWANGAENSPINNTKPFGKNGLVLTKRPDNKSWENKRLTKSKGVDAYDASFEIFESRVNSIGVAKKSENLTERLKGWTIEIRKRDSGTSEKFYHHNNSRRIFRSIPEVENFIFYEVYPPKPKKKTNQLLLCNEPHNHS